jgi:hypothetical protein
MPSTQIQKTVARSMADEREREKEKEKENTFQSTAYNP